MEDSGNTYPPIASAVKQINHEVLQQLNVTLELMRQAKPGDRSELDRRYAIAITELEKTFAYIKVFCL